MRLSLLGPGLLLAATGVGGGDMATGGFVGGLLGPAVLWAVLLGAFLKYVVTEGLARWQLATGTTFVEGVFQRLGPLAIWLFLPYLFLWSFFVGSAQLSATGVTLHAILPWFENAATGKTVFGIAAGIAGIALVFIGGYKLFENIMRACIAMMFFTVVLTAFVLWPGTAVVLQGIFVPSIPNAGGEGLRWTIALIGGVGGTLTILCYGYWLREERMSEASMLATCRADLAIGYVMTAIFGMAMVIIGSTVTIEGSGAQLLVDLAARLEVELGPIGKWIFLLGSFGAVFSSLLGVWQCVPYLFADCWQLLMRKSAATASADGNKLIDQVVNTRSRVYRSYLLGIGLIPMLGLFMTFRDIQQLYGIIGAAFFPVLALGLLIFNGRSAWVGAAYRNRVTTQIALIAAISFFVWIGIENLN